MKNWGARKAARVTLTHDRTVHIMGIDGTWRRSCKLLDISSSGARLAVDGSLEGLNLKEFFLLLSVTGLAFRRCELIRINGEEIGVRFLQEANGRKQTAEAAARSSSR